MSCHLCEGPFRSVRGAGRGGVMRLLPLGSTRQEGGERWDLRAEGPALPGDRRVTTGLGAHMAGRRVEPEEGQPGRARPKVSMRPHLCWAWAWAWAGWGAVPCTAAHVAPCAPAGHPESPAVFSGAGASLRWPCGPLSSGGRSEEVGVAGQGLLGGGCIGLDCCCPEGPFLGVRLSGPSGAGLL